MKQTMNGTVTFKWLIGTGLTILALFLTATYFMLGSISGGMESKVSRELFLERCKYTDNMIEQFKKDQDLNETRLRSIENNVVEIKAMVFSHLSESQKRIFEKERK